MDFILFPEATRTLGKPDTLTEAECGSLPVYADGRQCISCWQPTQQEREAIAAGLPVWLGVLVSTDPNRPAYTQPPVSVGVGKPDMPPVHYHLNSEISRSLFDFAKCLPDASYASGRPQTGAELMATLPTLRQYADSAALDPEQLYFVSSYAIQQAHYHALLECFRVGGQPAVVAYLKPYVHFLNTPNAQRAQ